MTEITVGKLVEFRDSETLKLGVVMGASKGGFQVRDQNGRQHKVATKNVLITHSVDLVPPYSSAEFEELDSRITSLQMEIDMELLWEAVQG